MKKALLVPLAALATVVCAATLACTAQGTEYIVPANTIVRSESARLADLNDERTDSIFITSTPDTIVGDSLLTIRIDSMLRAEMFRRSNVGIYVYDLTDNRPLYAHNEKQRFTPASNQKIMTSVTALDCLGADHNFTTTFSLADLPVQPDSLAFTTAAATVDTTELGSLGVYRGTLCIRGGYDPLLSSADLATFARTLYARGIRRLANPVLLDLSMKDSNRLGWGWCWDDDEVPTTPLLCNNKDTFTAELKKALTAQGITWDGRVTTNQTVPPAATVIYTRQHTLAEIIGPLMKRSNNSMAESFFYNIAAIGLSAPANRDDAVKHYERLIRRVGLNPDDFKIADGSGLSRYNNLSAELLLRVLRYSYAHPEIYDVLLPSLPIAGVDGTLRKRMRSGRAFENVRAKTGTLRGVTTLSGYCTAANGHYLCFSILNNGVRSWDEGRNFQDRLCTVLCEWQ